MLTTDAKETQAMQYRSLEATHFREGRIDVERVSVTIQAVQNGLLLCRRFLDSSVWLSLWRLIYLSGGASVRTFA